MKRSRAAVVGAAETTQLGVIPNMSQVQLHADATLNAVRDAGISISDIDGIATAGESPESLAHYLGITPTWIDATGVGGCSFLMHVRHATGPCSLPMVKADGPVSQQRDFRYRFKVVCFSSSRLRTVPLARRQCSQCQC
jgi:hypothetical protein